MNGFNSITSSREKRYAALIVGLVFIAFCVVVVQRACDRRAEQRENEKIQQLETEAAERLKTFQLSIDAANKDHETTMAILDTMAAMTVNINTLAENDKTITARVNEIEVDYKAARNQKSGPQTPAAKERRKIPIRIREIEALKVDEELYPSK